MDGPTADQAPDGKNKYTDPHGWDAEAGARIVIDNDSNIDIACGFRFVVPTACQVSWLPSAPGHDAFERDEPRVDGE